MREKKREKSLLLGPLNLSLWDLKPTSPFRKEKDVYLFFPSKILAYAC